MALNWLTSLQEIEDTNKENGGFDYIHIPQTAGNMLITKFNLKDTHEKIKWANTKWNPINSTYKGISKTGELIESKLNIYNHITATQRRTRLKGLVIEDGKLYPNRRRKLEVRKTLAVIRNPFDRVISIYYDCLNIWSYKNTNERYPGFTEWVELYFNLPKEEGSNTYKQYFESIRQKTCEEAWFTEEELSLAGHLPHIQMPQKYWISDSDGINIVDYVVKYEDIISELPVKSNDSIRPDRHYSEWYKNIGPSDSKYNTRIVEKIQRYYLADLLTFGYTFD